MTLQRLNNLLLNSKEEQILVRVVMTWRCGNDTLWLIVDLILKNSLNRKILIYHFIKYKYFTQAFLKIKHCIAQLQSKKADFIRSLTSKYDLYLKYRIPVKVRDTFILIGKII